MKITRENLLYMRGKKTQNPDIFFPPPKSNRFLGALTLVSYLVTQRCLAERAMPNEVVLWASVLPSKVFKLYSLEILPRPDS